MPRSPIRLENVGHGRSDQQTVRRDGPTNMGPEMVLTGALPSAKHTKIDGKSQCSWVNQLFLWHMVIFNN